MRNYIFLVLFPMAVSSYGQTPSSATLDFKPIPQTQSNWCWAACSAMILNNYEGRTVYTDCDLASAQFKVNCCAVPQRCNEQNSILFIRDIARAKGINANLVNGPISWDSLKSTVSKGNPVLIRVESSYGGHFIVINGYYEYRAPNGDITEMVDIYDPMFGYLDPNTRELDGRRVRFYEELRAGRFLDYGFRWTHSIVYSN